MAHLDYSVIDSTADFRHLSAAWNDLWRHSGTFEFPTQNEGIIQWSENFASEQDFYAIVVYEDEVLVGGLPLVVQRKASLETLCLPANCWSNGGDLLIRDGADSNAVIQAVLMALGTLKQSLLFFPYILPDAPRWQSFIQALRDFGEHTRISRRETAGLIEIGCDWNAYFQCLSSNHRSAVRRSEKQARKSGTLQLLRLNDLTEQEAQQWMLEAFQIENRSWKGAAGTSILASPGMPEYILQEAELARQAGMLELWFLTLDKQPIAFEYCHRVKNVCNSHKIGYDESFKRFGPGRLLRKLQLETLFADNPNSMLDTKGVLCPAKAKWVTRTYEFGCLTASIGGGLSKLWLQGADLARPIAKYFYRASPDREPPKIGGAAYVPTLPQTPPTIDAPA